MVARTGGRGSAKETGGTGQADLFVVAFRSGRGLVIVDFPIVGPSVTANIFNDGPDPVGEQDPFEDEDDSDGTSQDSIFRPDNTQGGQEPPPGDSSNTN